MTDRLAAIKGKIAAGELPSLGDLEWLLAENDRLDEEANGPVEFPPNPDEVCKERSREAIADLKQISDFARRQGFPGYCDDIRAATNVIIDLTSSYLECSAENDRLREIEDAALLVVGPLDGSPSFDARLDNLERVLDANPRPRQSDG